MQFRGRLAVEDLIDHTVVRDAWNRAAPRLAEAVATHYRHNLAGRLVQRRTGRLHGSVRTEIQPSPSGLHRVVVGAEDFRGAIVEGGAVGHEIRGHRGRLLRFRIGDTWIRARIVQHPGITPRRPLAIALQESAAEQDRILLEEFEAAAERRGRLMRAGGG